MAPEQAQEKFLEWQKASNELAALKEKEMQLRLEVGAYYFPDASPEGSHVLKLDGGWRLEYGTKIYRKLLNTKGETNSIVAQLPPELAEATVSWKPSLKMRGYKALPAEYRTLIDSVVSSNPGTPSLKLVPPKGEK